MNESIWSSSDSPYTCLKDVERTLAFREAIGQVVRPGDVVVDAGAGTGILSFFAAVAGASKVYAVEIDALLAKSLAISIAMNGLEDRITVINGDAVTAELPHDVDIFIGELIETGLIDEEQVRVVNALRDRGVIGSQTRLIPEQYTTYAELVEVENTYYGYRIAAPIHEWPNYLTDESHWLPTPISPLTGRHEIVTVDFRGRVESQVDRELVLNGIESGIANGVRISGIAHLTETLSLGQTNALNGDKILLLSESMPVEPNAHIPLHLGYVMGNGFGSLTMNVHCAGAK